MRRIFFSGSLDIPDDCPDNAIATRIGIKIKQLGDGTLDPKDSLMFSATFEEPKLAPDQEPALPPQPL